MPNATGPRGHSSNTHCRDGPGGDRPGSAFQRRARFSLPAAKAGFRMTLPTAGGALCSVLADFLVLGARSQELLPPICPFQVGGWLWGSVPPLYSGCVLGYEIN